MQKHLFIVPSVVAASLVVAGILHWIFQEEWLAQAVLLAAIALGSWKLLKDTVAALRQRSFALDYIALLAIVTGLITGNLAVAGVIVLMMSGGNALEAYAQERAKRSLKALSNRIPHQVEVMIDGKQLTMAIEEVAVGTTILVRKGEVVPLDGTLLSESATIDESSLTGEPYPQTKDSGDSLRSGTLNAGDSLQLQTTVIDKNSTYRRIIALVEEAQSGKAPFIQLADQLSGWFTVVTLALAVIAYLLSGDLDRVLAVLVIATPCPLILATPIAMMGGINAAAQQRVIFKRLASLEVLARVKAIVFDKTGTLTLGVPQLEGIELVSDLSEKKVLQLAAGLERHSLHPIAKAILSAAKHAAVAPAKMTEVEEVLGKGIRGKYQGETYALVKEGDKDSYQVVLKQGKAKVAIFSFRDVLKKSSFKVMEQLAHKHVQLHVFTGDTLARATQILGELPAHIKLKADASPVDKQAGIVELKKAGVVTAMVGDGINDAPALAEADVGLVFSHQEHTAASEAADVVLLGGNFEAVLHTLQIARRTLFIAKQSMYVGLGLSLLGMTLAVFGKLPPIAGAISQEVIDVAVILNALRAAFWRKHAAA